MSKTICIYIYNQNSHFIKRFDHIEVSQESLNRVINNPKTKVMPISTYYSPNNYILRGILGLQLLWVSRNEGEVVDINSKSNLWLSKPDDALAIQKFLEYEIDSFEKIVKDYEQTIQELSSSIKYLQSKMK